jgi:hypothetical protein
MSDLEPISEITKTLTLKYFYISKEGSYLEANLETHTNNDLGPIFISNSGFKDFANNLGINLEEFRFKYSTVSQICEHGSPFSGRCYDLYKVFDIFADLKAGLLITKDYPCCSSKMPLCSIEMRDMVCWNQISTYPPGFLVNDGECLLNEDAYWMPSTQRLRAKGVLFNVGDKEYTIEKYTSDYFNWKRYDKKRKSIIRTVLRLDNQKSLIYRDKDNKSEYY